MAEDFYRLFNVGNDEKYISTIDPAGVALAGIQQLTKENEELRKTIKQLMERLKNTEDEIDRRKLHVRWSNQQLQIEKLQMENDTLKKELELIKKKLGM